MLDERRSPGRDQADNRVARDNAELAEIQLGVDHHARLGAVADASGRRKPWIATFGILFVAGTWLLWEGRPGEADTILLLSDGEPLSLSILEMISRANAIKRVNIMVVSIHKDLHNRHYLDALATRDYGQIVDAEPSD